MASSSNLAAGRRSEVPQRIHRRFGHLLASHPDSFLDKIPTQQGDTAKGESARLQR